MAILLKTVSVRVSSIQIMQVRVQNKGKRVWKSRYGGDVSRHGKTNHVFPHLSRMGSFSWEVHEPWVLSMLSQMGSCPLEERGCRVPSLMSQLGSFTLEEQMVTFPLEEPERVPSSWSLSMRSDLEDVDPKPASQNVSFRNDKRGSMAM